MNVNDYQREAMTLLNPVLTEKDVLMNALMGLCGESGEAIDLMKKHLYQGHALDRDKLIKELGDIVDKLHARYPQGFDTQRSQHRESEP